MRTTLALLVLATAAVAQENEEHAWLDQAAIEPAEAAPGEVVDVRFVIRVDEGWHVYPTKKQEAAVPTSFHFEDGVKIDGAIVEPATKHHKEKDLDLEYDYIPGNAEFVVPVRLPKELEEGEVKVRGVVRGQVCKDMCFDLELPFSIDVRIRQPKVTVASVSAPDAAPGGTARVALKVRIDEGWHIYSVLPGDALPTKIELLGGRKIEGAVDESKPKHHRDEVLEYDYHEGEATFTFSVKVPADAKPGPLRLAGRLTYQPCTDEACLQPETIRFATDLTVAQVDGEGAAATAAAEFEQKGWLWLVGFAIAGGLFSLVQPCVYPLLPVTITYFVKQGGDSHGKALFLAAAYGLGIVVTFTALGFILSATLGASGTQLFASNPWVNLGIAAMFFAFALSMFGLFEIQLPSFITGSLTGGAPKSGVPGAFLLGLLFAIVSFTCTIPIAATILGIAASSSRWAGGVGMLIYSGTMAVPFLLFGLFPALLRRIPKSGGWLHTMKVTGGFLEIALAGAYIWKADLIWEWGVFDRGFVLSMWIATALLTSLYLFGIFRVEGDGPPKRPGWARLAVAAAFLGLAGWLAAGFAGVNLGIFNAVLPPEGSVARTFPSLIPVAMAPGARLALVGVWLLVSLGGALWLLDALRPFLPRQSQVRFRRLAPAIVLAIVAAHFGAVMAGEAPGVLGVLTPPGKQKQKFAWPWPVHDALAPAEKEAAATGKLLFVEFTGVT